MGRKLSIMTLLGVFFGYAAGIVLMLPSGCTYASFLFGISFSLMYGSSLCKAIAIDKIFNNESLKVVTLTENCQVAYVVLGAFVELAVISGMFAASPMEETESSTGVLCTGDRTTSGFLFALLVLHVVVLLLTMKVARRTRRIARRFLFFPAARNSVAVYSLTILLFLPLLAFTSSGKVAFSPTSVVMLNFMGTTAAFLALIVRHARLLRARRRSALARAEGGHALPGEGQTPRTRMQAVLAVRPLSRAALHCDAQPDPDCERMVCRQGDHCGDYRGIHGAVEPAGRAA